MRLPNGSKAEIDLRKLADYVLNPAHPRGRNKARVFAAALGVTRKNARVLQEWLAELAATSDNVDEVETSAFGRIFEIRAEMRYMGRTAQLRSAWMIRHGEDFPRLVTVLVE
jgi:hypothetical protein